MDIFQNINLGAEPVLIAGPTASGKSALGLALTARGPVHIINADALQIYADWHILTARPSAEEAQTCPHRLYGHIGLKTPYSVGHWLREVEEEIERAKSAGATPVILGGTGLYFMALTRGLVDIPEISERVKHEADALEARSGKEVFADIIQRSDKKSFDRIDAQNPARTRRAWEVLSETGKGIADWQDNTPPPVVEFNPRHAFLLNSDTDWLNARIDLRFDQMIEMGALEEVRAVMKNGWDPSLPSCQAIGAKELVGHLSGQLELDTAIEAAKQQTRRYAKRQRTWFRSKMSDWTQCAVTDQGVTLL